MQDVTNWEEYRKRLAEERDMLERRILASEFGPIGLRLTQGQLSGINLAIALLPPREV